MATQNIPPGGGGIVLLPISLPGQRTASVAAVYRAPLPFRAKILGVCASARASGGTSPTLTIDLQADGASLLAAPIDVHAGASSEGVVAGIGRIADEDEITVDLTIGGTTPTWDDISILVTLARV